MRTGIRKTLYIVTAVLFVSLIYGYLQWFVPPAIEGEDVVFEVPPGDNFQSVAMKLMDAGIIRNARAFSLMAEFNGAHKRIQAGEYLFNPSMKPATILDMLVKGETNKYIITIPEGYNIRNIADLFNKAGLVEQDSFINKATDESFVSYLGIDGETVEGYLFPDTYRFTKGMSAEDLIVTMFGRFKSVYKKDIEKKAIEKGMSQKEVVTLASIIEKETSNIADMKEVSAVFHNRLRLRIPLQSDPTVIYGINGFNGNLTRKDLRRHSRYNTYLFYGLPPGPIANPGREALKAAIEPGEGEYLYFVSKNNGTHYFSKTLREHNRAVNRYQKRKNR